MLDLVPIKWVLAGVTAIVLFIWNIIDRRRVKQDGRDQINNKNLKLNFDNLLNISKNREKVADEARKLKACIPNDNALLDELHKKTGITTISEAAKACMSGVLQEPTGSDSRLNTSRKD